VTGLSVEEALRRIAAWEASNPHQPRPDDVPLFTEDGDLTTPDETPTVGAMPTPPPPGAPHDVTPEGVFAITVPWLLTEGPNHPAAVEAWRQTAEKRGHVITGEPDVVDLTRGSVADADGSTVLVLGDASGLGVTQVSGTAIPAHG
jgi:hypothetical protein